MMATVECKSKRKCVCSSRIVKLEEVVKELDSRLNVVEESLFGMDSMRGRMFQLEKSMENALDRIMPRLDALLGGLPASTTSAYAPFLRSFLPYPFESESLQVCSHPPPPAKNATSPLNAPVSRSPSLPASRGKVTGRRSPASCSVCRSKTSCSCSKKNVASSEVISSKTSAVKSATAKSAGGEASARSSTPSEAVVNSKNNGTNNRSMTSADAAARSKSDDPEESILTKSSTRSEKDTGSAPAGSASSDQSNTPSDAAAKISATNSRRTASTPAVTVPSPGVANSLEAAPAISSSTNCLNIEATLANIAALVHSSTSMKRDGTAPAGDALSVKHVPEENAPADNKSAIVPVETTLGGEALEKQLLEAAGSGDVLVCQKLLFRGVDPKTCDSDSGDTAMHYACRGGHIGCIIVLLAIEEDTAFSLNKLGQTPLMIAVAYGHTSSVQLLLHKRNESWGSQQMGSKALQQAVSDGQEDIVRVLLEGAVNPNLEENSTGASPLCTAASTGREIIVLMLVDKGADISYSDSDGLTALHKAAMNGHCKVVLLLIHKGADISHSDGDGQTALHKAAMNGHSKCVAALLLGGANPLHKDVNGWEPLHLAARAGHIECVKILLAAGVDVNRPAANGESSQLASTSKKFPELEDVLRTANTTIAPEEEPFDSL